MFVLVFIATFFSSIVGASFFGVSLNKIALIPLELYLLATEGRIKCSLSGTQKFLMYWYLLNILSCLSGAIFNCLYATNYSGMLNSQILWALQIAFIYIPIALLLWNSKRKEKYRTAFLNCLIITARIQAVWALAQFVLYYTAGFDLNHFFFVESIGSFIGGGSEWTLFSNMSGSGILLRVSGLNKDAAFLGLIMLLGFIIDRNTFWRIIYFGCTLLSFSRSGMIAIVAVFMFMLLERKRINIKSIIKTLIILIFASLGFYLIYTRVDFVNDQITRFIMRMATISTGEDGTSRHMGYILASWQVWFDAPFFMKIFGVGLGCAGCLMSYYSSTVSWLGLNSYMLSASSVWSIECDPANVLLGSGIIGMILYYYFYIRVYLDKGNNDIKILLIGILIFSIMYNIAGITLLNLVFIIIFSIKEDHVLVQAKLGSK